MSTYWDVTCLNCKSGLGLHGNHQDHAANRIAQQRHMLALVPGLHVNVADSFDFYNEYGPYSTFNTDWFVAHKWHDIAAQNEYGYIYGRCGEFIDGKGYCCNLLPNHIGECDGHPISLYVAQKTPSKARTT